MRSALMCTVTIAAGFIACSAYACIPANREPADFLGDDVMYVFFGRIGDIKGPETLPYVTVFVLEQLKGHVQPVVTVTPSRSELARRCGFNAGETGESVVVELRRDGVRMTRLELGGIFADRLRAESRRLQSNSTVERTPAEAAGAPHRER